MFNFLEALPCFSLELISLFSFPEVEAVIRRNVGVTRSEVKNKVAILELIAHPENMIVIRTVDVFIKIVEVACL
jgi:hypothetical protein